jgi:hypothetical protein
MPRPATTTSRSAANSPASPPDPAVEAVVFDLFGTLLTAPTPSELTHAASRLAALAGCGTAAIEHYFRDTWHVRHDGTLRTLADLATHLAHAIDAPPLAIKPVTDELHALGQARLIPAPSVINALTYQLARSTPGGRRERACLPRGARMKAWEIRNGVLGLHDVAPAHPPA